MSYPRPSQANESPNIQDFHEWYNQNLTSGSRSNTSGQPDESSKFIPFEALKEFFEDSQRLKKILNEVFFPEPNPFIEHHAIGEDCLRVLAILLCIKKAKYIGVFVKHPNLHDTRLPLQQRPDELPYTSTDNSDFFADFYKIQWVFCAPRLRYQTDIVWEPERILPFVSKDRIGGGGSTTTYKIELHPSYNSLNKVRPQAVGSIAWMMDDFTLLTVIKSDRSNIFVLKTFDRSAAYQHFENEVRAFETLRNNSAQEHGLVGFFGSFRQSGTFNILLEYANGGTLENYFEKVPPPTNNADRKLFWESLFSIAHGLKHIHLANVQDSEQVLRGYHQDINLRNILCSSFDAHSPYKCNFKLAGLGLSHFTTKVWNKVVHKDAEAKTFGAPECYIWDEDKPRRPREVRQEMDIWSLGCVFSLAAVWLYLGCSGLNRYMQDRVVEQEQFDGFSDLGSFHNGSTVLSAVTHTHEDVIVESTRGDNVTRDVLNLASKMLDWQPEERHSAALVSTECTMILRRTNFGDISDIVSLQSIDDTPSLTTGSTWSDASNLFNNAAEEIADILFTDDVLQSLFKSAFERVETEKLKRNLGRLITKYAVNLRGEARNSNQDIHAIDGLIKLRVRYIVYLIVQKIERTSDGATIVQEDIIGQDDVLASERRLYLERYLEQVQLAKGPETQMSSEAIMEPPWPSDANLEPDFDDEESETEAAELERVSFEQLERLKDFILNSRSLLSLREDLRQFVFPQTGEIAATAGDFETNQPSRQSNLDMSHVPENMIEARQPARSPHLGKLMVTLGVLISKVLGLTEHEIAPGHYRVQWICNCGQTFHQDFESSSLSAAIRLRQLLAESGYEALVRGRPSRDANTPARPSPDVQTNRGNQAPGIHTLQPTAPSATPEPRYSSAHGVMFPSHSRGESTETNTDPRWLLLCFDYYKHAGKAVHVPLEMQTDDVAIFATFRKEYYRARSLAARMSSWKEIKQISFVKFQLRLDPRTGSIPTLCDDWDPPTEWDMAHEWLPQPICKKPNIPSDFLLHHWNHPHDAFAFRARQKAKLWLRRALNGAFDQWKRLSKRKASSLPTTRSVASSSAAPNSGNIIRSPTEIRTNSDVTRKPCAIATVTPKKVKRELTPSPDDPPYGWGIYLHEGFAVPESIRIFALFLLFCVLFGVLIYCAKAVAKYGLSIFGVWGGSIGVCSLVATLLMKYSDSKK